jgi:hypothetical protein
VGLLLAHFVLISVELPQLVLKAVSELVFLDVETALVNALLTRGGQFYRRRTPVSQDVVCLVKQVTHAVEVTLDGHFHLIALGDLLPCKSELVIGFLENCSVVLRQFSLILKGLVALGQLLLLVKLSLLGCLLRSTNFLFESQARHLAQMLLATCSRPSLVEEAIINDVSSKSMVSTI